MHKVPSGGSAVSFDVETYAFTAQYSEFKVYLFIEGLGWFVQ
jgi:hypothetical protein